MSTFTEDHLHQGWLWKLSRTKLLCCRYRWNRRWFILKSESGTNKFVLEYYHRESTRGSEKIIKLEECDQIIVPVTTQNRRGRFAFYVSTSGRNYKLAGNNEGERDKWVEMLVRARGHKKIEEGLGGTVYARPSNDAIRTLTGLLPKPKDDDDEEDDAALRRSASDPCISLTRCTTGMQISNLQPTLPKSAMKKANVAMPISSLLEKTFTQNAVAVGLACPKKLMETAGPSSSLQHGTAIDDLRRLREEGQMIGQYVEVEIVGHTESVERPQSLSTLGAHQAALGLPNDSVVYTEIDQVRIQALLQMRADRERQFEELRRRYMRD